MPAKTAFLSDRPRMRRLQRAVWILSRIADGSRLGLEEAADHFGVSPRTIRRDVAFLDEALDGRPPVRVEHHRIYLDRRSQGAWSLLSASRVFHLLVDLFSRRDPAALGRLLGYLRAALTVDEERRLLQATRGLVVLGSATNPDPEILQRCLEAVQGSRAIRIHYAKGGAITERVVEPWSVALAKEAFYLLGYCRLRKAPREFRLDRILACELTGEAVTPPPDGGRAIWDSAFGAEIGTATFEVVVRFAPEVAYRVQSRRWHASERWEQQEDGGVIFRARVSSRIEVVRWVLAYGPYAELLAPEDLRQKLAGQLRAALAYYGHAPPLPSHSDMPPGRETR